ncbi:MAG: hypothetical protein EA427_13275 [Spirochaetaceae bacterium]|nr:MAG: hypothetical protein EA427_13275 [Spirochaetaceae bacterium]
MNLLQTGINILLLGGIIAAAAMTMRGSVGRDLLAGTVGAVLALGTLLLLRYPAFSWITAWSSRVLPRQQEAAVLLALYALVEEIAKYTVIAPWRQPVSGRPGRAAGRGLGFAGTEHLLFLLIPTGLFTRRLVLATTLHVGTALLYSRPGLLHRYRSRGCRHIPPPPRHRTGPAPLLDLLLIAIGTTVHFTYNLVLQSLDGLTVFW